jgi:hypothetical protein
MQRSYYIKGSGGTVKGSEQSALVKIEVEDWWPSSVKHHLASEEALEQGCMPSGTCLIFEVKDQPEFFYNLLWAEEDANNSELRAKAV